MKTNKLTAKKKKQMLLSAFLVLALLITAAFAFLTAQDMKSNVFTLGDVKIDVVEPTWDNSVDANGDGVPDFVDKITPFDVITKDPQIKNIGDNSAWVFASYDIPVEITENGYKPLFEVLKQDGDQYLTDICGDSWTLLHTDTSKLSDYAVGDVTTITYYYGYNSIVPVGQTANLFDAVRVGDFDNKYSKQNLKMDVKGYAMQSDALKNGNEDVSDVATAWSLFVDAEDIYQVNSLNKFDLMPTVKIYSNNDPDKTIYAQKIYKSLSKEQMNGSSFESKWLCDKTEERTTSNRYSALDYLEAQTYLPDEAGETVSDFSSDTLQYKGKLNQFYMINSIGNNTFVLPYSGFEYALGDGLYVITIDPEDKGDERLIDKPEKFTLGPGESKLMEFDTTPKRSDDIGGYEVVFDINADNGPYTVLIDSAYKSDVKLSSGYQAIGAASLEYTSSGNDFGGSVNPKNPSNFKITIKNTGEKDINFWGYMVETSAKEIYTGIDFTIFLGN